MRDYYAMESVRDLLIGKYEIKQPKENSVPLPNWNRCPCLIVEKCERKGQISCIGHVSIFINTPTVRWIYLEITFFREKHRAFIRTDHLQMQKLFELGIIADETMLRKETF